MMQARPSSNFDALDGDGFKTPESFGALQAVPVTMVRPGTVASDALRDRADRLWQAGDAKGADAAYARYLDAATDNPILMQAAAALHDNNLPVAERLLKDRLKRFPTDVAAIRMLAELATRLGRFVDAENLLARCLELSPSFVLARHNYAIVLYRQTKAEQAIVEIDRLLSTAPQDPNYRNLKAAALAQIGEYAQAIAIYAELLKQHPEQPKGWMSYGHALKTEGQREESIAAYRRSIEQAPNLGESYWSLANLKTFRFTPADIDAMRAQLARPDLIAEDRLHFEFALGKAMEDASAFAASFKHYAEGNRIRRGQIVYDPAEITEQVRRNVAFFDEACIKARAGSGSQAPDPIFIVGLPRSGSTLIEQILSSHSAVEGTMELPDLGSIARELGGRKKRGETSAYPEMLAGLSADRVRELGEEYLERTRVQRKSGRPFFIDKMPQNFFHVGLIHLILPTARIIDARRHPMGACFSAYKQHFARGQGFSYDLADLGRYYGDYARLMDHFDQLLPGRIHRVHYEAMVTDTVAETRRLLDYCGLPFEEQCLRFYENTRAVRTASSEQVRRPIFSDGVDHWRNFEEWLEPLKMALGPVLDGYPRFAVADQVA